MQGGDDLAPGDADVAAGRLVGTGRRRRLGLGGFSGVVPTLWCTLRGLPKDAQRSIIQNFNLAVLLATFTGYLLAGHVTRAMLPPLALVAAATLVPVLVGARLYHGLSDLAFRRVVLGLLTLAGLALLANAGPQALRRLLA